MSERTVVSVLVDHGLVKMMWFEHPVVKVWWLEHRFVEALRPRQVAQQTL